MCALICMCLPGHVRTVLVSVSVRVCMCGCVASQECVCANLCNSEDNVT